MAENRTSPAVVAADDLARLLGIAHERQRIVQDPLLQLRVVRLAERVPGNERLRVQPARRIGLRALLRIDGDQHRGNSSELDEPLYRHDRAVAEASTAG